ncbi:MAG TPA: permease-like cell division protein FtsX [Miltoncostaeaceae bacterium]|jgi:cell division transport system permease protein|nr:permease-like cell division protein FtsX [Miltoncostaeaceae bacterium]
MRPRFFLAEAFRSIRANVAVSIAATVTVLIAVFILGAFIPSFLYVQSSVDSQKARVDIRAYISDSAKVAQVNGLQNELVQLQQQGTVKSFVYINKDQALRELKGRLKDPSVTDYLTTNPIPANFRIKPGSAEQAPAVIAAIGDNPAIDKQLGVSYGKETTDKLLTVARFIQWAGLALITILLVASVLLIGNTIRLSIFARRREVEVMKLVGATNWFIRWPFVIEGIICGLVGALLSVALLWAVKVGVVDHWIDTTDSALQRDEATTIGFPLLGLVLIAAGALVGAVGSGITLRRFLKV